MTDPIRHEVISFKTLEEAEQFSIALNLTFGEYAFADVIIDALREAHSSVDRYVVSAFTRRLHLPKRVIAFAIGWVAARSYTDLQEAIMLVNMESHALYLYR